MVLPVLVAAKVGVSFGTGFMKASIKVMVMLEVAAPSATTGPVPVMLEFAATAGPAMNVTVPSAFTTGVAIARVLLSALVEERVQVETPEALVAEQAP